MEQSFDSSNYSKHYIDKFCSTNPFFETFQDLLISKNLIDSYDFDYGREYEKYFNNISREYQEKDPNFDVVSYFDIKKIDSIKKYCRKWFPKDPDSPSVIPPKRELVIMMGFVMKLNSGETNLLLKAAGFSELGGRIFDEAIIIYSLNNGLAYDRHVETYNKMMLIYTKNEAANNIKKHDIVSFSDLKNYLKENEEQANFTVQKLTIQLTNEVNAIKNEAQLVEYVKSNSLIFSEYRETARRYICKYLLIQLEREHTRYSNGLLTQDEEELCLSHFASHKLDFEKLSFEHIWKQFEKFYCFTLRVESAETTDLISLPCDEEDFEISYNRSTHLLHKFINGKREITRKFFILFLIFLGVRNTKKLDYCCANCGFDIISNAPIDNGFDDFIYHLLKQGEQIDFRLFLANVTEEIALSGYIPPIFLYKKGEL